MLDTSRIRTGADHDQHAALGSLDRESDEFVALRVRNGRTLARRSEQDHALNAAGHLLMQQAIERLIVDRIAAREWCHKSSESPAESIDEHSC